MNQKALAIFVIFAIVAFTKLSADPSFIKRTGDIDDEAHYSHNAITKILFNELAADEFLPVITVVPLYSQLTYYIFKFAGVGFFQLRILSVISGILILLILYMFTKDTLGQKQALATTALLAGANAFFIHIRLGRPENLMMFFILASFYLWHLSIKHQQKLFLTLSGMSLILAFLTKFSAVFTFPAFIFLWVILYYRKQTNLKDILYFISGGTALVAIFIILYLIPNWNIIYPYFLKVSGNNFFFPLYNIFWYFSSNFYGMPSVFLIFTGFMLYILSNLKNFQLKKYLKSLTFIEISSVSWLLSSIFFIFGDMSERRFYTLLIPFTILASIYLMKTEISFRAISKTLQAKSNLFIKILIYFLLFLPIFSLVYTFGILILQAPLIKPIIFLSFIILIHLLAIIDQKYKIPILPILIISFFSAIILPLSTVIRQLTRHILIILNQLQYEILIGLAITTIASACIISYLTYSYITKKDIHFHKKLSRILIVIIIITNTLLIGQQILFPNYSLKETSLDLSNYANPGDTVISNSQIGYYLTIENQLHPIWYFPFDFIDYKAYTNLHKNIEDYNPKLMIITDKMDGKDYPLTQEWIDTLDYNTELVAEKNILVYPFTNSAKIKLKIYTIQ